ncbi:MAG: hypothetical protein HRU03_04900 [Nanoarchaeales archaeon]|nr:hypothetical protein [Nanoarchaeales archaeon]
MIKTNKTNIFFLILTLLTLTFAGCSKIPDCTELNTQYEKYQLNEDTTTCELYKSVDKNSCGNGIAEEDNDETFCNCAEDVPSSHPTLGCEGNKGEYLEYVCSAQETCELQQNNKVISQEKAVVFKNSDVTFRANFNINVPFILDIKDNNKISVNLEYFKGPASSSIKLRNLVVKEMVLKNSAAIIFGTQIYSEQLSTTGRKLQTKYFELAQTTRYETKESLQVELIVSYSRDIFDSKGELVKTEDKIETLKTSIGSWKIINPNFED